MQRILVLLTRQQYYYLSNKLYAYFLWINQAEFIKCTSKRKTCKTINLQRRKSFILLLKEWSWRESNPRPNEEIISFLHAYLCLNFRVTAEPKPSTITLSS